MTKKQKRDRDKYQTIWMLEVRELGSKHGWSATGEGWYWTRSEAIKVRDKDRFENNWLEYRVTKYQAVGEASR